VAVSVTVCVPAVGNADGSGPTVGGGNVWVVVGGGVGKGVGSGVG